MRLGFNFRTLAIFVAVFSVVSWIIVTVATYLLSTLSMKAAGLYYLANDNFVRYLKSPVTWLAFAGCLIVVGSIQTIQIGGLIRIFYASKERKKVSVREAIYFGLDAFGQLKNPRNWSIFLFMVLMLPYLGLFSISNVSFSVAVPSFLREYLLTHRIWTIIYFASLVTVFIFTVKWMMSLHLFVLEHTPFPKAKDKSGKMIRHHFFEMVVISAVVAVVWIAVFWVAEFVADLLTNLGARAIYGADNVEMIAFSRTIVEIVVSIINMVLTPSFIIAYLSVMFSRTEEKTGRPTVPVAYEGKEVFFSKRSVIIFGCIFAGCCVIYLGLYYSGRAMHNTDFHRPEIVAHKGDSMHAPENTMPAFEMAIEEGVSEWIELDVRQSADRQIVVCHDDNLKRLTGYDGYVHEMTYDEIKQLDAGSWFSKKYAGTHLSTLEEVMDLCKGKIRLQIEIKPTSYDVDFEKDIAALINEKDMKDQCVVTSISSLSLKRIEEADPEIIRVYSLAAANGEIAGIEFADWFSFEMDNVTEKMIGQIHMKEKRVYVWTVNSKDDVQRLIDIGVDGILTDDPIMINYALETADYSGGLAKTLRSVLETPNFMLQFGF